MVKTKMDYLAELKKSSDREPDGDASDEHPDENG